MAQQRSNRPKRLWHAACRRIQEKALLFFMLKLTHRRNQKVLSVGSDRTIVVGIAAAGDSAFSASVGCDDINLAVAITFRDKRKCRRSGEPGQYRRYSTLMASATTTDPAVAQREMATWFHPTVKL